MIRIDRAFFRHAVYMPTVWVRGEPLTRCLAELEASQWLPADQLRALQEERLDAVVRSAARHVPYYRERVDLSQLPSRLTLDDLGRLPMVTKEDLRAQQEALQDVSVRRTSLKTTGGSTGQAVTVRKSRLSTGYELAAMWRGWGWAGVAMGDRQARFWGVPFTARNRWRSRMIDVVSHRKRFSAFGMTTEQMLQIAETLRTFDPDFVYGYVSVLHEFAAFLDATGTRRFTPKAVIATSEVLTPAHRAIIQKGFGCPVFEEYGCGEVGNIAHECSHGQLHLSAENLLVEVVTDTATAAQSADPGELVVTELHNLAMPLIRYRLKDYGRLSGEPCPCGRTLPVLGEVMGRAYDLVYNREGRMFHGEFFMYILEEAKQRGLGIEAFQVVQLDVERLLIRVRQGPGYAAETERFVTERIRSGYGQYAQVTFEPVETIQREASGKLRLIIGAGNNARS